MPHHDLLDSYYYYNTSGQCRASAQRQHRAPRPLLHGMPPVGSLATQPPRNSPHNATFFTRHFRTPFTLFSCPFRTLRPRTQSNNYSESFILPLHGLPTLFKNLPAGTLTPPQRRIMNITACVQAGLVRPRTMCRCKANWYFIQGRGYRKCSAVLVLYSSLGLP
jgi:hypothetical protein